nr:MAG TPA_asm: hypothetical protein [Caudoviricetes sp.]
MLGKDYLLLLQVLLQRRNGGLIQQCMRVH